METKFCKSSLVTTSSGSASYPGSSGWNENWNENKMPTIQPCDWTGKIAKLNYFDLHDRIELKLLREREPVRWFGRDSLCYDVTYRYESLHSSHANLTTIGEHLVYGDDEWAVSVDSSKTPDDVAVTPVLYTLSSGSVRLQGVRPGWRCDGSVRR